MVADMVTTTGEWDWDRLKTLLPSPVLETLAATPPPVAHHGDDVPGWRWDEKRQFRVSSAYEALLDTRERSHPIIWNKIWSLQVPQRVHVFMWITVHRRHLTNAERASILWRCVLGQEVVNRFDALPFDVWLHGNITDRLFNGVARDDWSMRFSVYCWLLWKRRCSIVLDTDFIERESVLDWATRFIEDCNIAYNPLRTAPTVVQRPVRSWEGPPHGWVKGNVDAAVNVSNGRAAVGGVFRDADGTWLQGFARFIGRSSVLVAELWTIKEGLYQAWNGGFRHVELETDNAEAAHICNGLSTAMQNSVLVSEIQEWLQRCWHVRVRYVDRASNAVGEAGTANLTAGGLLSTPTGGGACPC
ncbi:hypothetical protein V6N11_010533 [Hibiscus sabdariffa]|uniref:RNase H type-1 domain-containing protein n=1 Tax=Hibiscus sabdariffa TaxID=183260 RepID=A0ABR2S601_9ROSI